MASEELALAREVSGEWFTATSPSTIMYLASTGHEMPGWMPGVAEVSANRGFYPSYRGQGPSSSSSSCSRRMQEKRKRDEASSSESIEEEGGGKKPCVLVYAGQVSLRQVLGMYPDRLTHSIGSPTSDGQREAFGWTSSSL